MGIRHALLIIWLVVCVGITLRRPFFGAATILVSAVLKEALVVETYGFFLQVHFFEVLYIATAVGVLLTRPDRLGDFFPRTMVDWGIVGFFLAMLASAAINGVPVWNHKYIDLYFKAMVLYFLLSRLTDTPSRVTVVAFALVLGMVYLTYLAWDKFRTGELQYARPYWGTPIHEFGMQLVITLPLAGALVMGPFRRILRVAMFVMVPLTVLVGLRSWSRSTMVGIGFGLVLLAWHYRRRWYLGLLLLPFVVFAIVHQPEKVTFRLESIWTHRTTIGTVDESISGRFEQMRTAMEILKHHPALGIGPRMFFVRYRDYVRPEDDTGVTYTMHSVPLLILAEEGLIGFAVFYGLLVFGSLRDARFAARAARQAPELEAVAVVGAGALMSYLAWAGYSLGQPAMWTINIYGMVALIVAARRVTEAHFAELAAAPAPARESAPAWAPGAPATEVMFP